MSVFIIDREIKKEFLKEIYKKELSIQYVDRVERNLYKIDEYESILGKRILEMNEYETEDLFISFNTSWRAISVIVSDIKAYVVFLNNAINKESNVIPYIITYLANFTLDRKKDLANANYNNKVFLNKRDYLKLISDNSTNAQDRIALVLAWNLLAGKQYSNLLNLKLTDVNLDEKYVMVNGTKNYLSAIEMKVIEQAMQQKEYYFHGRDKMYPLIDGEYVLKKFDDKRNRANNKAMVYSTFNDRNRDYCRYIKRSSFRIDQIVKSRFYQDFFDEYHDKLTKENMVEMYKKYREKKRDTMLQTFELKELEEMFDYYFDNHLSNS